MNHETHVRLDQRRRILLFLTLNGPRNKGQIEKEIKPKIDHSTIHLIVKALKSEKRVESRKTGHPKVRAYAVNVRGLVFLIAHSRDLPAKTMSEIATKHRNLMPDIFDLWPSLIEAKIQDLAYRRLQWDCITLEESRKPPTHRDWKGPSTSSFLDPFSLLPTDGERWLAGIYGNQRLREIMMPLAFSRIGARTYQATQALCRLSGENPTTITHPIPEQWNKTSLQKEIERLQAVLHKVNF